jgi:hypothetical protein
VHLDIAAVAGDQPIARWSFDLGDGSPSLNGVGAPHTTITHQYAGNRVFQATLTVTDQAGHTATAAVSIRTDNPPKSTTRSLLPENADP